VKLRRSLRADARGSTLVELAFALPVLIILMMGVLQLGLILWASGGVQHGVGEGIRYAKIYRTASTSDVEKVVRANFSGVNSAAVRSVSVSRAKDTQNREYAVVAVTYEPQLVIPFVPNKLVTMVESKRAYLPE
jgi:Flp pilus assembly protein TadG